MSVHATAHQAPVLMASTLTRSPFRGVAAQVRRAAGPAGDVLMLGAVIFCIPFVILAIGMPIALFVQLLLWFVRLF